MSGSTPSTPTTPRGGATIQDVPQDVLREGIFCFAALERETERLRALAVRPYGRAVLRLLGEHATAGFAGVDCNDFMLARAGKSLEWLDSEDENGERALFTTEQYDLYRHISDLTYDDKVSIIPSLVERNLFVTQFAQDDGNPEAPAISVRIGKRKANERSEEEERAMLKARGLIYHGPRAPRFAVGAQVEVCTDEKSRPGVGVWLPGRVVRHWYFESGLARVAPYQVRLEQGDRLIYAPEDSDHLIRLAPENKKKGKKKKGGR